MGYRICNQKFIIFFWCVIWRLCYGTDWLVHARFPDAVWFVAALLIKCYEYVLSTRLVLQYFLSIRYNFFLMILSFPSSYLLSIFFFCFFTVSNCANEDHVASAMSVLRVEDTSPFVKEIAASSTEVIDVEIDCKIRSWSVVEYKSRYADTLHVGWFRAFFSDGTHLFTFDRHNVLRNTDIGTWTWW